MKPGVRRALERMFARAGLIDTTPARATQRASNPIPAAPAAAAAAPASPPRSGAASLSSQMEARLRQFTDMYAMGASGFAEIAQELGLPKARAEAYLAPMGFVDGMVSYPGVFHNSRPARFVVRMLTLLCDARVPCRANMVWGHRGECVGDEAGVPLGAGGDVRGVPPR